MRSGEAAPFVALVPESDRFKSFHLVDPVRGGLSRGAAVTGVGRRLAPAPLRWIFSLPGVTAAAGALYWLLVRAKPAIGRLVADRDGPHVLP